MLRVRRHRRGRQTPAANAARTGTPRSSSRPESSSETRYYVTTRSLRIHINGYIERLTISTLNTELKLTRTSYLTEAFGNSVWSSVFRDDINLSKAAIFLGYSLYDLDIARILFEYPEWQEKCVFVTATDPSDEERDVISKFGTIVPIGLESASDV